MRGILIFVFLSVLVIQNEAKIFTRCEVAKRLLDLGADRKQLATWVCIAHRESSYNTGALNINRNGSKDYGIFQINNRYWCDRPGNAGCKIGCSKLQDNDIADDFRCAQQIYKESRRIRANKGDGFNAWVAYKNRCSNGRSASYLQGC